MMQLSNSIIDFSNYVSKQAQNFTGRKWVFQAINDWLADPEASRFFLITGEPGSGKTAIAAKLYQFSLDCDRGTIPEGLINLKRHFLSASYFCSARDSWSVDPRAFTESLASQLASKYPKYREALAKKISENQQIQINVKLENVQAQNVAGVIVRISSEFTETIFNLVIREPLEAMYRGEDQPDKAVILVDALDEALTYSGKVNIVSLLARLDSLTTRVSFLVTSRHVEGVDSSSLLQAANMLFISDSRFDKYNYDDTSTYIRKRFVDESELAAKISVLELQQVDEIIYKIATKAEGNFLYIRVVLDAIAKGQQSLIELEKLPTKLENLYHEFLGRITTSDQWSREYAPLIGILSVAQESLTESQLQNFTGLSERIVSSHLTLFQQFMVLAKPITDGQAREEPEQHRYKLYHQSFVDFLRRKILRTGQDGSIEIRNKYYLPAHEWHKTIVDYYGAGSEHWKQMEWSKVDDYGLLYLASHLYALIDDAQGKNANNYRQNLYELISRDFKHEKLGRYDSHHSFIQDVKLAIDAAYSEEIPNLLQLIRGSLIYSTVRAHATDVPSELFWVLILLGEEKKSLDFAELRDRQSQMKAYQMIGEALLKRGKIEDLEKGKLILIKVLESLENDPTISDPDKADSVSKIGAHLMEGDEYNKILDIVSAIGNEPQQTSVLSNIANNLVNSRKFDQARKVANEINDIFGRDVVLSSIVQAEASIGAFECASRIVDKDIEDDFWKSWALSGVADICSHRNEKHHSADSLEMARQKALLINKNFKQKVKALSRVAEMMSRIEENKQAAKMTHQFMDNLIEEANGEDEKLYVQGLFLPIFVQMGKLETAAEIIKKFMDAFRTIKEDIQANWLHYGVHEDTLEVITEALAKAGEFENVLKVTFYLRRSAVDRVAFLMAKSRGLREALAIVNQHGYGDRYSFQPANISRSKIRIVEYLIEEKEFEKAISLISDEIEGDWKRADLLVNIAYSMAQLEERRKAEWIAEQIEKIAKSIKDLGAKAIALTAQAIVLILTEDKTGAKHVADDVIKLAEARHLKKYEAPRARTLAAMIRALAQSGKLSYQSLYDVIDQIQEEPVRTSVLLELAQALAEVDCHTEKVSDVINKIKIPKSSEKDLPQYYDIVSLDKAIVALTLVRDNNNGAQRVLEQIPDDSRKARVLATAVNSLSKMGKGADAIVWARMALEITEDVSNTVYAIASLADSEGFSRTLETANDVWQRICREAFAHSDFDRALEIVDERINDEHSKSETLLSIVKVIVGVGNWQKAKDVAETLIKNEQAKTNAFVTIGQYLIQNHKDAKDIIKDLQSLSYASIDLLKVMAELGLENDIKYAAEKIKNRSFEDRAYATSYMTQAMARANPREIKDPIKLWTKEFKNQLVDDPTLLSGLNEFYQILLAGVPFLSSIDQGPETLSLSKICDEIIKVEGWWTRWSEATA
jgi:hypothetical protein